MIGRLRQLSEPRLRQQAGIEKSQTPVERDILVQWVRKKIPLNCFFIYIFFFVLLRAHYHRNDKYYCIYSAIRQGFSFSRMTKNN